MRKIQKLTALAVKNLSKPGYHSDGAGLYLQVSPTGSKSWVFRYSRLGKPHELGLGSLNAVSLANARIKAEELRLQLATGTDPLLARKQAQLAASLERARAMTFDQCAEAYIKAHRADWKNPKHVAQWVSTLNTYASPSIGKLPVAEIDTSMIVGLLRDIWEVKTETASRVRGRIEKILDWATTSQFRFGENPARWKGHLENLLAKPSKAKKVEHHPALSWQEMGDFMVELRKQAGVAARALEFTILTVARSGTTFGATWDEIDFDTKIWTIPARRMKAEKEHRVPLSTTSMKLLQSLPKTGELIFGGARQGKTLSNASMLAVLERMGRDDITVHGFRSTFRDWAAESLAHSFSREVAEQAMAHKLKDKVEEAYRRGDLIEKRALLMQAWADYCNTVPKPATVTALSRDVA